MASACPHRIEIISPTVDPEGSIIFRGAVLVFIPGPSSSLSYGFCADRQFLRLGTSLFECIQGSKSQITCVLRCPGSALLLVRRG